jgi:predicted O-linked N-acetylglucosamine transferase (SPINDLY family)
MELTIDQALKKAIEAQSQGRFSEAENIYQLILVKRPDNPDANHNLGDLAVHQGKLDLGLKLLKKALEIKPTQEEYWISYINVLMKANLREEAKKILDLGKKRGLAGNKITQIEEILQENKGITKINQNVISKEKGLKQNSSPSNSDVNSLVNSYNSGKLELAEKIAISITHNHPKYQLSWKILADIFKKTGRLNEGLAAIQQALLLLPNDAESYNNQGVIFKALGRLNESYESYRQAVRLRPGYAEAHNNIGNVLKELGRLTEAKESYQKSINLKPDLIKAHSNLAIVLGDLGKITEAAMSYKNALSLDPNNPEILNNFGNIHKELGNLLEAMDCYQKAISLKPDYAEAHNNLGVLYGELSNISDAQACFENSIRINQNFPESQNNLGNVYKELGNLSKAHACYQKAINLNPNYAEAYSNLGTVLKDLGDLSGARECYYKAIQISPNLSLAYSNLLFLLGYHSLATSDEYLSLASEWERAYLDNYQNQDMKDKVFNNPGLTSRRLKIGYVSGDYCDHALSYFVQQLFIHHDKKKIELYAYSTSNKKDDVTIYLQRLAEHWRMIAGIDDESARNQIERDGIDVLIDLSGHTNNNRLGIFALRAAPIQSHYLGYFASTGVSNMDFWIGDEILTPQETDNHFKERIWRLPRVWVSYEGKDSAPIPTMCERHDDTIWLGSFNHLGKITKETLSLWAKVLHAIPQGKLLLKTKELADQENRNRILLIMGGHGIPPDRIELQDRSVTPSWSDHMAYYNRLDIALDPIGGIGGGTTTCDALWMGVPVVTLLGKSMGQRMTASMLTAIDHSEWIANSESDYIAKTEILAKDKAQRTRLRFEQREKMRKSQLCDPANLACTLENAYKEMFNGWWQKNTSNKILTINKSIN